MKKSASRKVREGMWQNWLIHKLDEIQWMFLERVHLHGNHPVMKGMPCFTFVSFPLLTPDLLLTLTYRLTLTQLANFTHCHKFTRGFAFDKQLRFSVASSTMEGELTEFTNTFMPTCFVSARWCGFRLVQAILTSQTFYPINDGCKSKDRLCPVRRVHS